MTTNTRSENMPVRRIRVRGNPVEPARTVLPTVDYDSRIREIFGDAVEAHSRGTRSLLAWKGQMNGFVHAAYMAFDNHYPLVISPDMIWLLISQGFAQHLNAEGENLRHCFVAHKGKQKIVVIRDEFVRGFAGNDWEGVFAEFSSEIHAVVGAEKHSLIAQEFSTTGIVEKAAVEVCLMDAMQNFFDFMAQTRCGIPEFVIEGEGEDWRKLRAAALRLEEYDLGWWIPHLKPLLDAFVAASEGNSDEAFWGSFFSWGGGSGGPYVGGHINALFPYAFVSDYKTRTGKLVRNSYVDAAEGDEFHIGVGASRIPLGVSVAPFVWKYLGKSYQMDVTAGFIGATQEAETLAVRPEIGWGVRERELDNKPENKNIWQELRKVFRR